MLLGFTNLAKLHSTGTQLSRVTQQIVKTYFRKSLTSVCVSDVFDDTARTVDWVGKTPGRADTPVLLGCVICLIAHYYIV